MRMKRLISSLTAAAMVLTSCCVVTASAEASVYAYTYEDTTHTLNASASEQDASGLYVSGNTDISIPGLTKEVTTFGELTQLYSGLTFDGFTIDTCSVEGLTEDDFEVYIFMMYGDSWTWYQSAGPEITFADVGAGADDTVGALGYVLRLKESVVAASDLTAGDIIRVNYDDSLEYYTYDFSNENLTMTVEESQYTESGLSATFVTDFEIPGVEYGVTTVGELKDMYCGFNVAGYSFKASTVEGMTAEDISTSLVVMTGNYAWNAVYDTTTMDFSTGLPSAASTDVVLSTGFHVSVSDASFAKLGLQLGDTLTVNSDGKWRANFKYDTATGLLSWDNNAAAATEVQEYNLYANGTELSLQSSENIGAVPVVDLAWKYLYSLDEADRLTGDIELTIGVNGGETAEGSYTLSYDGCDESAIVSTPANVALDSNGYVVWSAVDGAVGYIFRACGENIIPYSINNHGNGTGFTSDWGMAKLCMSGNGVEECTVEIYAVDINGDVSKAFTALYSELSERKDYNIHFDENGMLCWDEAEGAESYILMMSDPAGMYIATDRCGANNSANYLSIMQSEGFVDGTYIFNVYSVDADGNETFLGLIEYEYTLPSETVGENVFYYTDNGNGTATITGGVINDGDVVIPSEVAGLDVIEVGMNAFDFEANIETLVISEGIERLGWYAFNTCENLTSVTLPESLEYIDSWAFERCYKLTTINIPANVSTVKGGAFAQNKSMTSIACDPANKDYVSVDGVLFTKDMDALVAYPAGITGAYTVPATVNHIGDAAFYGATGLESVTILGQLDFIGFEAFAECEKLTDVKINEGVNYVGYWAFRNCTGIKLLTVPQSVTNIGDEAFGYGYTEKLADFTLRGYKDSAVYYYAIRHDIPFICIGEADAENMPFDDKNAVEEEVDFNPATPEEDRITSIVYKPGFNMKDKSEAGVGLDLSLIKVKANEVYDEEGLARAEAALGTEIVGKTHYNLLDITLMYGEKDYSKGYDGLVEVQIPIPPGHQDEEFYCYRILDDGTKEIIPGKRFEDHYSIYLEHFSVYALVAEPEHTCEYSDNWSNDAENHWHECSCGAKSETAAHTASEWIVDSEDADVKYKECTVCGYIMETADAGAEDEAPASGYSAESVIIPTGETVIHKTATVDGVYSQRFVEKVAAADLESAEKVVFTVTNGTKTAVYESNKCYNSLNVNGEAVSAGEGYVFLCLTIKDIPEDIAVSIKSVDIK